MNIFSVDSNSTVEKNYNKKKIKFSSIYESLATLPSIKKHRVCT